tara:strand:- start:1030 stop:1788 length:759 start_codon:yes stop_codon:yes gene_type:complete
METLIKFHDGEELILDFNEGKHIYKVEGEYAPSVTTILNSINKPALIPWAASEGAKWFSNNAAGFLTKELSVDDVAKGIRGAYKEKSRSAMDIGQMVHSWCEKAILWKLGAGDIPEMPDNEAAKSSIGAFQDWIKTHDIKWISAEQKVYNRRYKYAGTVDAVAEIDDEFCVVDFKTSARIYDEYHLQCAAYAECVQDIYGREVDSTWILRFDKKTGMFESAVSSDNSENFSAFYGALLLYSRLNALKNRKKR